MPVSHCLRLLTLSLLLIGCSLLGSRWPDRAPERAHYIEAYSNDPGTREYRDLETYLLWVSRFYQGFNIVPGWLDLTDQVMDALPEGPDGLELRLYDLGKKISTEWSRHPRVRLINSRMANTWRDALLEARDRGEIIAFLGIIEEDVDALLLGSLNEDDIYFERYYEDPFEF